MARAWLRGVEPQNNANVSTDNWGYTAQEHNSIIYYFMTRCLKWTLIDEVQVSGRTFESHQELGTAGSFTGSSYRFTDTAGSFIPTMVGEFICLVDPNNEENSGVYLITNYVDADNIDIDFYTTAGNYPTAGTGIEWWVLDRSAMPKDDGAYVILESPHATSPVTIQFMYQNYTEPNSGFFSGGNQKPGFGVRMAVGPASENWDAVGHDWTTLAYGSQLSPYSHTIPRGRVDDPDHNRIYAYGKDDGSFCLIYSHHDAGAGNRSGFVFGVATPAESTPTHDGKDLPCIFGPWHQHSYNQLLRRNWLSDAYRRESMCRGDAYSSATQSVHRARWCDWHGGPSSNRLFSLNTLGANEYTSEFDGLPVFIWVDPDDDTGAFQLLGTFDPTDIVFSTTDAGVFETFDSDQWMHIDLQVAFPWPGFPTYY